MTIASNSVMARIQALFTNICVLCPPPHPHHLKDPPYEGSPPLFKLRREEIKPHERSDLNLTNSGYTSKKVPVSNVNLRGILAQINSQRTPTAPGTEPRILLRTGSFTILLDRQRRSRPSPVALGQTSRHRPRLITASKPHGWRGPTLQHPLLPQKNQKPGSKDYF